MRSFIEKHYKVNIKLMFLSKRTTAKRKTCLQPFDTGIIRLRLSKYSSFLLKYILLAYMKEEKPSDIIQNVDFLKPIHCLKLA